MRQEHPFKTKAKQNKTKQSAHIHTIWYTQKPLTSSTVFKSHSGCPGTVIKLPPRGASALSPPGGPHGRIPDPYGALGVRKLGQDGVRLVTPGSLFVVVISEAEAAAKATAPPPERSRRFGMEPATGARKSGFGWSVPPKTKHDNAEFYDLQILQECALGIPCVPTAATVGCFRHFFITRRYGADGEAKAPSRGEWD